MIDPNLFKSDPSVIYDGLNQRGDYTDAVQRTQTAYETWKTALAHFEQLKSQQNANQTHVNPRDPAAIQAMRDIAAQVKAAKQAQDEAYAVYQTAMLNLPNIPTIDTPAGRDESDNILISQSGEPGKQQRYTHDTVLAQLGWIDMKRTGQSSGARFVTYSGQGARLKRALIHFMLDQHNQAGYQELSPPVLVNTASLQGTGQLPKFEADLYRCGDAESPLWLSPTAEVQLTNYYQQSRLLLSDLPLKLTAYTPCFRREAGAYGKDLKGIIRLHQFDKVELVEIVGPDQGEVALQRVLAQASHMLDLLGLHYRVVQLCAGDLGFSAAKTYDIEVWFPAQQVYREISSCSLFTTFQARRAGIRYYSDTDRGYAVTVNGSALAIDRTIAALVETYQTPSGSCDIPAVLDSY